MSKNGECQTSNWCLKIELLYDELYQILTMEKLTKEILYICRILMNIVQLYTLQLLLCPESCIVDSDNSSSRESLASANPIFDRLYISWIVGKPVSLPKYRPHSFAGYIQGFLFVGIFLFYVHVFFVPLFPMLLLGLLFQVREALRNSGLWGKKRPWHPGLGDFEGAMATVQFGAHVLLASLIIGHAHFWPQFFFCKLAELDQSKSGRTFYRVYMCLYNFIYSYPQLPLHFCVNAHTFLEALPYDICSISYPPVIKHGKGKSSINGKFTIDVGFSIVIFDFQRVTSRLFRQLLRRKTWNSSVLHVSWLFWLRWKLDLRE